MRPLSMALVALALLAGAGPSGLALAQGEAGPAGDPSKAEPATAATTAPVAVPTADDLRTADEVYGLKVREIEGRINDLKEQIFASKAKLTLLTEQIAGGLGTGATAVIVHENKMSGSFLLTEVHYFLDGQPIWQETDENGERLTGQKERLLLDGNLVEGSHTLTAKLVYKGQGSGMFSYMAGYTMTVNNALTFTAEPGKVITIRSVGYEQGNFMTELTERPAIRFDTQVSADQRPKGGAR
jgi:hypothetical protein